MRLPAARRTATSLDDRLIAALERPLTYGFFLVGGYAAVHGSPLPQPWTDALDAALFVLSVLLLTLAAIRSYGILLTWYTTEARGIEIPFPVRKVIQEAAR